MELKKANLHMDRVKCQINTQITLEEDKNISDRNPDAARILMEKGRIEIEELRPGKDMLSMKGKMRYEVLYESEEENGRLYRVQGEIPWEEKVRIDGMENIDVPQVLANIEDLRSNLINSRKISVRALVNFCVKIKEIRDEEILLDITGQENMEIKKEPYSQSVIAVDKKDVFRIKEDLELPSSLPPVGEVLWQYLDLGKWEIRPLEDNIGIQGELNLFLLYESSGEDREIKSYETTIPFSGNIECPGCNSNMIADITPTVSASNINIKQDYDGEDRVVEVEMVLELPIQIYERREMEQITDVYGTSFDIVPEYKPSQGRKIGEKYQGRMKVTEALRLPASSGKILQICHINTNPFVEDIKVEKEGLKAEGILSVTVLYMVENENKKFDVIKKELPFSYQIGNLALPENSKWKIVPMVEQCSGVILDENNIEVKIAVLLEVLQEEVWDRMVISNLKVSPFSEETMNYAPGMVVYIPQKRESVWDIGKQYNVSQEAVKEINQLTENEVEKGQKILLVRGL